MTTTVFEYSALSVNITSKAVIASVKLRNTGHRTSDEVCQVYTSLITNRGIAASPPLQDFQAFQRVAQLAPGESVSLIFDIPLKQLQLMDVFGKLRVLPGTYNMWVGGRAPTGNERRNFGRDQNIDHLGSASPAGTPHRPLSTSFQIGDDDV